MKKFEAATLEEAYSLATSDFDCSITDLEINIVQQPTSGFLGFGKKPAIIMVILKKDYIRHDVIKENRYQSNMIDIKDISEEIAFCQEQVKNKCVSTPKKSTEQQYKSTMRVESKEPIFDKFYSRNKSEDRNLKIYMPKDQNEIIEEIKKGVDSLFKETCFILNDIKVEFYDEETIYIEFSGEDSALLIGKEGYRYKALSYILFNWINEKYGLMLRLEVAEFLKNQEEAIRIYLEPLIQIVKDTGSCKTKTLDGILVHIALKKLRDEFPLKYVAVKTNPKGDKYVLVNEYRAK